jgi:hypothetical protein
MEQLIVFQIMEKMLNEERMREVNTGGVPCGPPA